MRRGASTYGYDVTPDGERFIMVRPADTSKPRMNVVLHWFQEFTERVPVP